MAPAKPTGQQGDMNAELTIKGRVESLHLEEGDKIIVTIDEPRNMTWEMVNDIKSSLSERFPGHEIVVLHGLSIARQTPHWETRGAAA